MGIPINNAFEKGKKQGNGETQAASLAAAALANATANVGASSVIPENSSNSQ